MHNRITAWGPMPEGRRGWLRWGGNVIAGRVNPQDHESGDQPEGEASPSDASAPPGQPRADSA